MEQFDQLLTCAICLDRYRNPKLLPCQHSFCMEPCMEGLVNYVTRQVKCPECRAEHRIPYQGIQQWPSNVTLQRFLELHIEITGELPDPTSGQVTERCGVCSEKNYCTPCSHCDKKVCADCKEGHMDILRREISRVNNQVRRTVPRLTDSLSVIEKNSQQLQQNCASIIEEVDDVYRRLSRSLKERADFVKSEIEVFLAKESLHLTSLKENLQHEIGNFDSNSDFAEKHIGVEAGTTWDDNELMDAKDIFLRTMEFIRNFESEPGEYHRRVRFFIPQDLNQLAASLSNLGELTINPSSANASSTNQIVSAPTLAPGLMRSKSDHRIAAQFRQAEERYNAYGTDSPNEGRTSPSSQRRYFGDRTTRNLPAIKPSSEYDFESDLPDSGRRTRFRSRFMRHHDTTGGGDSDNELYSGRSVRFNEQNAGDTAASGASQAPAKKERQRVLDTEDATRGPLSGITRLLDSPRVLKRIQEMDGKGKKKTTPAAPVTPAAVVAAPVAAPPVVRKTNRQVSEEDEIAKIKKQNKAESQTTPSTPTASTETPVSRRVSTTIPDVTSPTTTEPPRSRFSAPSSTPSTPTLETTPQRRFSRNGASDVPKTDAAAKSDTDTSSRLSGRRPSYSRTSSGSSVTQDDTSGGRTSRVGRLSLEQLSSSSAESSTHSSPVRTTGAAFSTDELRNRFSRTAKTSTASSAVSDTPATVASPRSRFGTVSSSAASSSLSTPTSRFGTTSSTSSAGTTSTTPVTPRFQSRFLGRAGTPTAEASRGSENSQSNSSSEDSSESESNDSDQHHSGTNGTRTTSSAVKDRDLSRTDIGPLLARSAQAREPAPFSRPSDTAYTRRSAASTASTASTTSTTSRPPTDYSTRLTRSRTGSSLHSAEELENKYPLTSKYLNRSRANLDTPPASSTSLLNRASSTENGSGSSYSSGRYGSGYRSRFLNRSKSSAALASENGDDEDDTGDAPAAPPVDAPTSAIVSGEERYPSGRSRYAALKDRRSRLARSKSSHEVPADAEVSGNREEVGDTGTSSPSQTSGNPDSTNDGSNESSLSTWARYLKNKYGQRNKDGDDANDAQQQQQPQQQQKQRRKNTIQDHQDAKQDVISGGVSSVGVASNMSHNAYMQKRRVQMKFGVRGSDQGSFTWPRGVAVGPDNSIVVADSSNHRVQVFDAKGRFLKGFGTYGQGEGEFDCLAGVAINRIGQYIIADRYNHRIQVFDPSGRFLRVFGSQGTADGKFSYPWGVTTDALGFIYVCDKENHRVQVFQSDGTFVGKFGSLGNRPGQLEHPHYIAVSSTNRVIVSDSNNHRIQVFDVNGKVITTFGGEGAEEAQFKFPRGVAVDDQGYIIVADSGNNRIQIFNAEGVFMKAFGCWGSADGEFKGLEGIAVQSNGNIVVCDRENHRIQLF